MGFKYCPSLIPKVFLLFHVPDFNQTTFFRLYPNSSLIAKLGEVYRDKIPISWKEPWAEILFL